MCTAISFNADRHYFGRNLDLEGSFGEGVTSIPHGYPIAFRRMGEVKCFSMIGMAIVRGGVPLWFDAVNEYGLGAAGLNFPANAVYLPPVEGKKNVAPFEMISFLLGQCKTADEAAALAKEINVTNIPFDETLPVTPLHWMVSDREKSIVLEPVADGLKVYENTAHVLTNNPPFPEMMTRLNDYMRCSPDEPVNTFSEKLPLKSYSRGMGAMGLPGDFSSPSRFARAAFLRANCTGKGGAGEFFRMLYVVSMPHGAVRLKPEVYEETVYSSCCDTAAGIYYYITKDSPTVYYRKRTTGDGLVFTPLKREFVPIEG